MPWRIRCDTSARGIGRGDALDEGVAPRERGDPLTAAGMKHFAAAAREVHDHAGAPLYPLDCGVAVVSEPNLRDEFRILIGEVTIVGREVDGFLLECRHAERKDLQPLRGAARLGGLG